MDKDIFDECPATLEEKESVDGLTPESKVSDRCRNLIKRCQKELVETNRTENKMDQVSADCQTWKKTYEEHLAEKEKAETLDKNIDKLSTKSSKSKKSAGTKSRRISQAKR